MISGNCLVGTLPWYGSEAWTLWKTEEDLLDGFQRNCLWLVLGTRLTNRISNSRIHETYGSVPLSRAIMREKLRWLGRVLWMKDDRLSKIVLFGQLSRSKWKGSHPRLGRGCCKKTFKRNGNFLGRWKDQGFECSEQRRSARHRIGLRWLGTV